MGRLHWTRGTGRTRRSPLEAVLRTMRLALGRDDHEGPVPAAFPNGHFYSPVPNAAQLEASGPTLFAERATLPGLDFDDAGQLALIAAALPLAREFDYPDGAGPTAELDAATYFRSNSQFGGLDALALFALLRHWRPDRIIEVGSGFSTLLMADVKRRFLNGRGHITCIEPYPRPLLERGIDGVDELVVGAVQDVPFDRFEALKHGDLLFIDSSHVAKTGSDVVHLLLDVLPRLAPGVLVHVHDIFLPDEYPRAWAIDENRGWNEQYLLRALLTHSNAFRVRFAAHYATRRFPGALRDALALNEGEPLPGGGSFWIERP
jgi:predicted O-methyltransferase YrrM